MGPRAGEGVQIEHYEKNYLQIVLQCNNSEKRESFVEVPILFYKGYVAIEPESNSKMELCAGENNVIRVLIPPGFEGRLEIKFVPPIYWRISELISGITIILLIGNWGRQRRSKHV